LSEQQEQSKKSLALLQQKEEQLIAAEHEIEGAEHTMADEREKIDNEITQQISQRDKIHSEFEALKKSLAE
jgi:DNA repair exonuclease SbcCD ATPase subunit